MMKTNTKKKQRNVDSRDNPAVNKDKEPDFVTIGELELLINVESQ